MRKQPALRPLFSYVLVTAGIIFVLFWLGPFSTGEDLPPLQRLLYWSVAVLGNAIVAATIIRAFMRWASSQGYQPVIGVVAGSLISALPGTANIFVLEYLFRDLLRTEQLVTLYIDVAIVTLFISLIFMLFGKSRRNTKPMAGKKDDSAFVAELTGGRPLLHLEIQDHYLQVHTENGARTVLMRLRDAIRQLDPERGIQVHRSHWVSHHAVRHVERNNGRVILHLVDGNIIPVSRSFLKSVRQAKWYQRDNPFGK